MPTIDQLERNARVFERRVKILEGRAQRAAVERRAQIIAAAEASAHPRPEFALTRHKVLDRFNWVAYSDEFVAHRDWRPTVAETYRRIRYVNHVASLR